MKSTPQEHALRETGAACTNAVNVSPSTASVIVLQAGNTVRFGARGTAWLGRDDLEALVLLLPSAVPMQLPAFCLSPY